MPAAGARRVRKEFTAAARGELLERSFAHCYDTGGMRRTYLRGHNNIRKRQVIHVGAFNLSLIMRKLMGAGTPREWKTRGVTLFFLIYSLRVRHDGPVWFYSDRISMSRVNYSATARSRPLRCRSQRSPIYTTSARRRTCARVRMAFVILGLLTLLLFVCLWVGTIHGHFRRCAGFWSVRASNWS